MTSHSDVPGFGAAQRKYEMANDDDRFLEAKCPECDGDCVVEAPEQYGDEGGPMVDCPRCEGKGTVHPSTIEREE